MLNGSSPQPHVERRTNEEPGEEEDEEYSSAKIAVPRKRLCDFCGDRQAILFCRPDSAKLCFSCDREVHSTNQLFTKHSRSLLCDSCDSSPASILCSTESLVLCQNCDWETHNRCASTIHERRPLEGFSGCPSANELLSIVGLDGDVGKKPLYLCDNDGLAGSGRYGLSRTSDDVLSDVVVWDTPSIVTLDDLIFPGDSEHFFQAMGVPPLPKNRKATCGQHKDEIHCQLRELLRLEPGDIEQVNGFYSVVPQQDFQPGNVYTGCEHDAEAPEHPAFVAGASQWCSDSSEAANPVVSSEDAQKSSVVGSSLNECQTQDPNPTIADTLLPVLLKVSQHELKGPDRESAISRYKEKRKTRRFEKHIRYESRKVRAESRVRIKGRFAKTGWSCDMGNGQSN